MKGEPFDLIDIISNNTKINESYGMLLTNTDPYDELGKTLFIGPKHEGGTDKDSERIDKNPAYTLLDVLDKTGLPSDPTSYPALIDAEIRSAAKIGLKGQDYIVFAPQLIWSGNDLADAQLVPMQILYMQNDKLNRIVFAENDIMLPYIAHTDMWIPTSLESENGPDPEDEIAEQINYQRNAIQINFFTYFTMYNLPRVSGIESVERIKQISAEHDRRIRLMSSEEILERYSFNQEATRGKKEAMDDFFDILDTYLKNPLRNIDTEL